MINDHESHILDRLKHPEQEEERRKMTRNLFIRNIINSVFIILALIAMTGIALSDAQSQYRLWWYGLGLLAVIVKMVEAMMRMPGLKK